MGILDGKAAVVTGSGRGVGRGHALHLAANGAKVVVNDIDEDEAQKVVDEVKSAGGTAVASGADPVCPTGSLECGTQRIKGRPTRHRASSTPKPIG